METTETRSDLRKEMDKLREDFRTLRGDVRSLLGAVRDTSAERLGAAGKSLHDGAADRYEQARQRVLDAYERGRAGAEKARNKVASNPLTSIAIAAGVGLLLGRLWARTNRRGE